MSMSLLDLYTYLYDSIYNFYDTTINFFSWNTETKKENLYEVKSENLTRI